MSEVTIYHNPSCTTSRKVLAAIRASGTQPRVIEYLKTPPTLAELKSLLDRMGMTPRALLRRRGTPYEELALDDPNKSDAALIDAMLAHPVLIERPIVVTQRGVRLCRPVEKLAEIFGVVGCAFGSISQTNGGAAQEVAARSLIATLDPPS